MTKYILLSIVKAFSFGSVFDTIISLLTAIIAFFAPLALMYHTFTFVVIFDMITGMIASKKRGEKIESKKMRKTIFKLFIYILVASGFYMFQMAIMPAVPMINLAFGLIILTEIKSLTENCDYIFKVRTFSRIYKWFNELFSKLEKKEKQ